MLTGNEFATLIWSVGVLKEESFSLLSIWACKRSQCKGHDTLLLSTFFSISSPTCSPSCTHMVATQHSWPSCTFNSETGTCTCRHRNSVTLTHTHLHTLRREHLMMEFCCLHHKEKERGREDSWNMLGQ
ncbi:hypothetical protein V8G54_017362 [Vigna mungo]|uniref:Uncharacterized protein n=1 Tax=Vigna mungo TaxID=3915 RepID=A0AAQ3NQI0_VIGMU